MDHFVPVVDSDYNPIRVMLKAAELVGFMKIKCNYSADPMSQQP